MLLVINSSAEKYGFRCDCDQSQSHLGLVEINQIALSGLKGLLHCLSNGFCGQIVSLTLIRDSLCARTAGGADTRHLRCTVRIWICPFTNLTEQRLLFTDTWRPRA